MNWDLIQRIGIPLLAALAVLIAPAIGKRVAHKTADAAILTAVAATEKSASDRWQAHTESVQKYADGVADRLGVVERRLDDAELRSAAAEVKAVAAELRATKAETLYKSAIVYLKRISAWANEHIVGLELPPPPSELEDDLK